jgi:hypothetical protein
MFMHHEYRLRTMILVCMHRIVTASVALNILTKYEWCMMSQLWGSVCLRLTFSMLLAQYITLK